MPWVYLKCLHLKKEEERLLNVSFLASSQTLDLTTEYEWIKIIKNSNQHWKPFVYLSMNLSTELQLVLQKLTGTLM